MRMQILCGCIGIALLASCARQESAPSKANPSTSATSATAAATDPHGWLGTETLKTRSGNFEFKGGYPTPEAAKALHEQLVINRAAEVYLSQMPAVAIAQSCKGFRAAGAGGSEPFVIWESLMDAKTLLLTANTETVYGLGCRRSTTRPGSSRMSNL